MQSNHWELDFMIVSKGKFLRVTEILTRKVNFFFLTAKGVWEWFNMSSNIVRLIEIFVFADNHEAKFSMVTTILAKLNFSTFGLIQTAKGCRGWVDMVSKNACLIEIFIFADNHEAEFSMVTTILPKLNF